MCSSSVCDNLIQVMKWLTSILHVYRIWSQFFIHVYLGITTGNISLLSAESESVNTELWTVLANQFSHQQWPNHRKPPSRIFQRSISPRLVFVLYCDWYNLNFHTIQFIIDLLYNPTFTFIIGDLQLVEMETGDDFCWIYECRDVKIILGTLNLLTRLHQMKEGKIVLKIIHETDIENRDITYIYILKQSI